MSSPSKKSRMHIWFALSGMIAPIVFLTSIPWLKQQPDAVVHVLGGIAATICIVSSLALAIVKDQHMDEWHRSAARFSSQWGWLTGGALVVLFTAVPAARELIVSIAQNFSDNGKVDERMIMLTFMGGFTLTIFVQTVCTVVLSLIWRYRMSRP